MKEHPFSSLALLFIAIIGICFGSDKYSERRYQIGYDAGYEAGYAAAQQEVQEASVAPSTVPIVGAAALGAIASDTSADCDYILNKSTKKFHYPYCASVSQMNEGNKIYFSGKREDVIKKGYKPCGRCDP